MKQLVVCSCEDFNCNKFRGEWHDHKPCEVLILNGTETMEEVKDAFLQLALEKKGYNITHTAEAIKVSTRTVQRTLKRWKKREGN